jgi:hypothetical protein
MIAERRDAAGIVFGLTVDPLPLIDPTLAAAHLGLKRHTLACYRNLGEGPTYYKFGRAIRYARADLLAWASRPPKVTPVQPEEPFPLSPAVVLIETIAAARFLTVTAFFLKYHRTAGRGPRYRRYGNYIYYAVNDLRDWAEAQRVEGTITKS